MGVRGPKTQERFVAVLVIAASLIGTFGVQREARALDVVTERRRSQLEQLAQLGSCATLDDGCARALAGLFGRHEVVLVQAAWGAHLALRPEARAGLP